jgi:predicted ATPase
VEKLKLLYFWFDEYKKLKDFEANLGSEYYFSFNFNNKCIIIDENKSYIKDFFKLPSKESLQNINSIDVSAIVGENGSGKSTVLDFLVELMSDNIMNSNYILIYSINDNLHILSSFENEISYLDKTSKEIKFCNSPINFQEHLTLLFSNVFDAKSIGIQSEDEIFYKNITTNFLIRENTRNSSFLISEFEKQIYFIHEYKEQLDIQNLMRIPNKIFIDVRLNTEEIVFTDELEDILAELQNEYGKKTAADIFDYPMPNTFYNNFYTDCLKSFFIHVDLLINEYRVAYQYDFENDYSNFLYHFSKKTYKNIFNSVYMQIKEDLPNEKNLKPFFKELFGLSQDFNNFCSYFSNMRFNYEHDLPYIFTDNFDTKKFISLYQKAFTKIGCLKFTWSEMSSGEYGMLSLFSRFHHILKILKKEQNLFLEENDEVEIIKKEGGGYRYKVTNYKFPTSYLLLIDEGDLYFHPQWQKDWLIYFIRLAELIFSGEVQIILTTHSPFVLSDFPNTNVIFLKNNTHTLISSPYLEGSPKTFASNIIELFSNSFFIKDGLIGSFAKEKTNHFIHHLLKLSPEETYQQKEEIKKFIDIIGEPLIRNKVLQIYNGKLELYNENDLGQRILSLEQELKQLKELKHKGKSLR